MKTEDDLASDILLLATIEALLVVLSRMLSALTEPQAQNSLARYRLQARKGQQERLGSILAASAGLAFAGAYGTVYLGILLGF